MNKANANDKVRTLIVWEIPAIGSEAFIEMYINPESISIQDRKLQNKTRTKGGYVLQYWGEEITAIAIQGTVGAGGIEALNVLKDVYRSEQLAMQQILQSQGASTKRRQSLAQLATSVIMWYQGQGYRGFFEDFRFEERTSGYITYSTNFSAVEIIGRRKNDMPWQRKPWSTIDRPSFDSGRGYATGGAYDTNYKIGEMNAPAVSSSSGTVSDPQFTSDTKSTPSQDKLLDNLSDNNERLTPGSLFAK